MHEPASVHMHSWVMLKHTTFSLTLYAFFGAAGREKNKSRGEENNKKAFPAGGAEALREHTAEKPEGGKRR